MLAEVGHRKEEPFAEHLAVPLGVIVDVEGMLVWIVKSGSSDGDTSCEVETRLPDFSDRTGG